jgi:UDP-N-acetylglucosamine 2-epimerase
LIHIFIGTKAQFIKTAPVILELQKRDIAYDSGQHATITKTMRQTFRIKTPDVSLRPNDTDITRLSQALRWTSRLLYLGLFQKKKVFNEIFAGKTGICIIHGDTLSTLLSLFLAKRARIAVAHIESGLRSFDYLNPFPEELIRVIAMKFSDFLFAPSNWAYNNLRQMALKGKIFHTQRNTVYDAIQAIPPHRSYSKVRKPYVLLTTHRYENISTRNRMKFVLDTAKKISDRFNVVFVLHRPTELSLRKYGYLTEFHKFCKMFPMLEYFDFLNLIRDSEFVMTDGGSIQEECFYLGIPCLLFRNKSERDEGIGKNVYISKFKSEIVDEFLKKFTTLINEKETASASKHNTDLSPSKTIVDTLIAELDS